MRAVRRGGVEHVENPMRKNNPNKKTFKLMMFAIVLAVGCIAISVLEMFDLHPQLSLGKFHSYWVGVRKMDLLSSGPMVIPLTDGTKELYQEYNFGLVKVVSIDVLPQPQKITGAN